MKSTYSKAMSFLSIRTKICERFMRQFRMTLSNFMVNHSKTHNITLNLEFVNTLFNHLDSETLFQNLRIFIIKVKEFITLYI